MLFRMPDKIDSVRALMMTSRPQDRSHVKGFSCDKKLSAEIIPKRRRGKDKWNVDKSSVIVKPIKKQNMITVTYLYGT